jgi:hypothetical protein
MTAPFLALLPTLFLLDVVARMRERTRRFVGELHAIAQDPLKLADLRNLPEARAWFEGRIAFTEEAVHLLIHERAGRSSASPAFTHAATATARPSALGLCRTY